MLSEAQLQELWDRQLLHDNMMQYARGVDRMDHELMKSAYWPDSIDDHGVFIGGGQEWADVAITYKDLIWSNSHHVSNVMIEIENDRAKRESMFINVVNYKEPAISMFEGGRYRDLCEKRDGEWRILHRVCIWDWAETRPTQPGFDIVDRPFVSDWGGQYSDDPIRGDWEATSPRGLPPTTGTPVPFARWPG